MTNTTTSPIKLFTHNKETWVTGLGKMHAQEGFPIELSLDQCVLRGWVPCLASTEVELLRCGVSPASSGSVIRRGLSEMIEAVPDCWRRGLNLRYFDGVENHGLRD